MRIFEFKNKKKIKNIKLESLHIFEHFKNHSMNHQNSPNLFHNKKK